MQLVSVHLVIDLAFLYFEQKKYCNFLEEFNEVKIFSHFADFGQVRIFNKTAFGETGCLGNLYFLPTGCLSI